MTGQCIIYVGYYFLIVKPKYKQRTDAAALFAVKKNERYVTSIDSYEPELYLESARGSRKY